MAKETQIALFNLTTPELSTVVGLAQKQKLNDKNELVGITLSLEKRKDAAKRFGLVGKTNVDALNKVLLGLSDKIKEASIGEFAQMAASPEWTGSRMSVSVNKSGVKRATMSLVSVNRQSHKVTPEQLAEALASMSEEQQIAIMEKAEDIQKQNAATNVASTVTREPLTPAAGAQ